MYKGHSIDASFQVSVHLAKRLQRRRLQCEKLTDDRWQTTDAKWWQKLAVPLARWANDTESNHYLCYVVPSSPCHSNFIHV